MTSQRLVVASLFATLALAACGRETPADPAIADAMERRHEGFEAIGGAFKTINDTLKAGGTLDAELTEAARTINQHALEVDTWFPAGSGPEAGDTEALPSIWEEPQDFEQKVSEFRSASADLLQAAEAGDADAFAAQVPEVGRTCKGCHDRYRLDD